MLRLEFSELGEFDLDFYLDVTGFSDPEIDALVFGDAEREKGDAVATRPTVATTRVGDLWLLGRHRLLCGDATDLASLETLLAGERARVAFEDPPYNCKIAGHVTGAGKHGEFVMASGEMTDQEFTGFLERTFARTREGLMPGGLAYICMDFRNIRAVLDAAEKTGLKLLNLIVWDKGRACLL